MPFVTSQRAGFQNCVFYLEGEVDFAHMGPLNRAQTGRMGATLFKYHAVYCSKVAKHLCH